LSPLPVIRERVRVRALFASHRKKDPHPSPLPA
jgi:hypothetical protein